MAKYRESDPYCGPPVKPDFDFIQRHPGIPLYDVYDRSGKYLGSVKKTCFTSGSATRWKAEGKGVNSDGHVTREHAARQLSVSGK